MNCKPRAGEVIARATGAEAGYVTTGAAAGLALGIAACVAGLDVGKMDRLPDTTGMKNEVVVQSGHRNAYDHAIRSVGVKFVEAGYLGYPGAGGTMPWQIDELITERTRCGRLPDPRHPRHPRAARSSGDRPRQRRSGNRGCRRGAAATFESEAVHRRGSRFGHLLRRESDRRAAIERHSGRPGRSDRFGRAPASGHGRPHRNLE